MDLLSTRSVEFFTLNKIIEQTFDVEFVTRVGLVTDYLEQLYKQVSALRMFQYVL